MWVHWLKDHVWLIIWQQFPVYLSAAPLHPSFSVLSHWPACTPTDAKIAAKYSCNNKNLEVISEVQEPAPQLVQISADQFTALEGVLHWLKICPSIFILQVAQRESCWIGLRRKTSFFFSFWRIQDLLTQMPTISLLSPEFWGYSLLGKTHICSSVQFHLLESMSKLPS